MQYSVLMHHERLSGIPGPCRQQVMMYAMQGCEIWSAQRIPLALEPSTMTSFLLKLSSGLSGSTLCVEAKGHWFWGLRRLQRPLEVSLVMRRAGQWGQLFSRPHTTLPRPGPASLWALLLCCCCSAGRRCCSCANVSAAASQLAPGSLSW